MYLTLLPCLQVRLGYCFTPYQRLWLYNGVRLVAFYNTLGIRRTYSRLKPPASSRGPCLQETLRWHLDRGTWTPLTSWKPYIQSDRFFFASEVLDNHKSVLTSFGIQSNSEELDLLYIYWIPTPVRARGVKSRMCPPYPQRDRKRRLNGAVCRNHPREGPWG